jgi:hypothetical protein
MIDETRKAFLTTIEMLEDGIAKIPDDQWRNGTEWYLVPACVTYHIIMGLEWFITTLPPREHIEQRRFKLDESTPADEMPDRSTTIEDLAWITGRIEDWFSQWSQEATDDKGNASRMQKALYFLRHTQHHIGEFSTAVRLLHQKHPTWKFPNAKIMSLILEADGPKPPKNYP